MSDKKRKVPKLRFPGFTDEWEQRKLGEIYQVNNERNGNQYSVEKTISIATMTFNESGNGADEKSLPNYKVIRIGDIAFEGHTNKEFRYGRFVLNDLENGLMSPRFTTLRPIIEQEFSFWKYYIHSERVMRSKLVASTKAGTMMNELVADDFFNQTILVPSLPEQEVIGNFFRNLDNLITLHQRKSENLQKLKKGLLQKMFPKNKECVPELRFPGFADTWEQRKLGNIVERVRRKNQDMVSTLPLTISAQYGLIDQNEFFDKRIASKDVRGYYLIYNGEFAYNKSTSNDAPWGAIKRLDRYENGVLSTLYIVFKIKNTNQTSSNFLTTYYDSNVWHKEVQAIAAEGARNHGLLNIAPNDFFETELMIPQDVEEQQKIGDYFNNLNNLITLHQRKLEHLEDLKKGLLQQMFI